MYTFIQNIHTDGTQYSHIFYTYIQNIRAGQNMILIWGGYGQ